MVLWFCWNGAGWHGAADPNLKRSFARSSKKSCAKILGTTVICCFILVSSVSAQAELLSERILLTFIPNIQFAPFYVGMVNGHFADQGFEVTLEHLQEPDVLDLVAAGQANFGIVSGEQVILARAQGRDVVYVYEWFQEYPVGIVMVSNDGEADLEDLNGMTVGIPGRFGASYSGLTTLLQSADLSEDDIQLNEIGFNAPDVFCLGVVEAAVVYVNNEPLQIRNRIAADDCGDTIGNFGCLCRFSCGSGVKRLNCQYGSCAA